MERAARPPTGSVRALGFSDDDLGASGAAREADLGRGLRRGIAWLGDPAPEELSSPSALLFEEFENGHTHRGSSLRVGVGSLIIEKGDCDARRLENILLIAGCCPIPDSRGANLERKLFQLTANAEQPCSFSPNAL